MDGSLRVIDKTGLQAGLLLPGPPWLVPARLAIRRPSPFDGQIQMNNEFVLSIKQFFRFLLIALVFAAADPTGKASAQAPQEVMPTDEVVRELAGLTAKLTPFNVRYEPERKILAFTEDLADGRIGELEARLDRIDVSRIPYEPFTGGFVLLIKGRPLAGQVVFRCREGQRCVRRGIRELNAALAGEESTEPGFLIDIVGEGQEMRDLARFAHLVQHLVTISSMDVRIEKAP